MATNAQWIFDTTMGLIDEVNEQTGSTDTTDTREYKVRTLFILNTLRGELYPYSDTFKDIEPGKRPIVSIIENFDDDIDLDDYICQTIMPYGLAAHLLMDENPTSANFFQQRYDELKMGLMRGYPSNGSEDIVDVYGPRGGISPYNEFSGWN
jgi:hypothetical protein